MTIKLLLRVLRGDRGEEPKITMIRVSHAKQYFVLAFTAGPFELWDARKLCLLRDAVEMLSMYMK